MAKLSYNTTNGGVFPNTYYIEEILYGSGEAAKDERTTTV